MVRRMPVANREHRQPALREQCEHPIERRDHGVAIAHGETAPGQEIVLNIDDEQSVTGSD